MSTGFSFGSNPPVSAPTPFGGTNTFGASTTNTQFGFGSNPQQQQQQQPAPSLQFGLNLTKPTGAVAPQPTNMSFGAATTTAAGLGGGLSFGTTPAPSAAPVGFGFNTPTTTSTALSFGTPASTGLTFGTPASTGLSFGTPASTGTSLNFGTTPQTTATSLSFGAAPATTALNFGTLPSSLNTPATNTGFSLGGTTTASSTTPGFSLGSTSNAAPSLNFGTLSTTSAPTGLAFGTTTTAAATTPSLNLGTLGATTSGALNFGISAPSTSLSTTLNATPVKPQEKLGLGGVPTSAASSSGIVPAKEIPPKEQQVPNEIQQDIENFKNYVKQQKLYSSDVSRCCVKDFRGVESQIGILSGVIKDVESQLERNRCLTEKLKYDTAQSLQLLEMAQRTQDTPAGLQYENVAPMNYFLNLADKFEKEMHALKIQIENTDKYVKNCGQPSTLTSQDLSLGMKRLHDTFVALAGRLQSVHTQVESQKELYVNLRKQLSNDFSNPFESIDKKLNPHQTITNSVIASPPKIGCGPTPFNQIIIPNFPMTSQQNSGNIQTPSGGFGSGASTSLFGNKPNTGFQNANLSFQNTSTNFQLQKPPTGNKRGKQ